MRRILVTGASGAFGPSVLARLSRRPDFTVFGTDMNCPPGGIVRPCDMRDRVQVEALLGDVRPDVIVHLAGTTSAEHAEAYAINVEVARTLLETVEKKHRDARVVLTGSAAEYGVVSPAENPIPETHALAPVSIYGMTKAWQTLLAHFFTHRGVEVVVARPFNLDGPGLSDRLFIGRVQRQMEAILSGKAEKLKVGPLSAVRDYLRFEEAARQYEAIARFGAAGQVYHVASGVPVSMREVLAGHLERHGLDFSCVEEDAVNSNRSGYDVPMIYADTTQTRRLLMKMEEE